MNFGSHSPCVRSQVLRRPSAALALAAALVFPVAASAAIRVVDLDGTYDASTNGCTGPDAAFTTINAANTAAIDGDTIFVCPGTYVEVQIFITKAITLQGSGAGSTIIDGGGLSNVTTPGTIRINTNTGDVTVDGFTIQNPSSNAGGLRYGIQGKSTAAVTFTITNNVIKGTNNPAATQDFGVYTDGPSALESWVFQYNTITQTGSNPILIERHVGPTDFSYNTFDRGISQNGVSAYFNMSHSGTAVTSLQRVSNNTINLANDPGPYVSGNASGAISFVGGFTGAGIGTFSNVEITGNTITGVQAFRRGITLTNNSAAPGTNGTISNAVVSCNTISGPGAAQTTTFGIRTFGLIVNPDISNNAIDAVETGYTGRTQNTHIASGVVLEENSFSNVVNAIDWWSNVALDAESNWFGDASGPTEAGNPSGTGAKVVATGGPSIGSPVVDYIPWLGSGNDADAGTCFVPGNSTDCAGVSTCTLSGCTAPPANEGGACDDGLFCNGGDTCTAGACGTHGGDPCLAGADCANICDEGADSCNSPSGTTCSSDGDVCTLDACDGAGSCANTALPDTDADGDCDAIDACTNVGGAQTFGTRPKSRVVMTRINTDTTPNDDTLALSAAFILPASHSFADITPVDDGVRLVVVADDGTTRLDVTVPAGAYTTAARYGWKRSGNGKAWTFVDRRATPVAGIIKVVINDKNSTRNPRQVKVRINGKKGNYPVVEADVPIQAIVTLGDAAAAADGLCGESAYSAAECFFNKPKNRLVCLR